MGRTPTEYEQGEIDKESIETEGGGRRRKTNSMTEGGVKSCRP